MVEPPVPLTALSEDQRAQAHSRFPIIRPALEDGVTQAQGARIHTLALRQLSGAKKIPTGRAVASPAFSPPITAATFGNQQPAGGDQRSGRKSTRKAGLGISRALMSCLIYVRSLLKKSIAEFNEEEKHLLSPSYETYSQYIGGKIWYFAFLKTHQLTFSTGWFVF
jgi:hypothetical protein